MVQESQLHIYILKAMDKENLLTEKHWQLQTPVLCIQWVDSLLIPKPPGNSRPTWGMRRSLFFHNK